MNLPSAESEQWTCKQVSNNSDEQEFALHPYDHVGDRLADKHRCDDAVSSSATHGSVSTSRASKRQTSDRQTDTPPTSDGKAMGADRDDSSTRKPSPDSSTRTHIFNGRVIPPAKTARFALLVLCKTSIHERWHAWERSTVSLVAGAVRDARRVREDAEEDGRRANKVIMIRRG